MALGVEVTSDPEITVGRKQVRAHNGKFYLEADEFFSEINYYKSAVSATSHSVTLPTGKKFHLRSIIAQAGAGAATVSLYSSAVTTTTRQLKFRVNSMGTTGQTVTENGLRGFCFTTYVKIVVTSTSTGLGIALGGILDAQPDV